MNRREHGVKEPAAGRGSRGAPLPSGTMTTIGRRRTRSIASPAGSTGLAAVTLGAVVAVTAAVVSVPYLKFAYEAPQLHVMLETVNAVVASIVAYLVYGRFTQHRRLQELLVTVALGTVAAANLVLTALPDALGLDRHENLDHWAPLALRLLGTVVLAAAALTPARVRVGTRLATVIAVSLTGAMVVTGVACAAWSPHLPALVDPLESADGTRPLLVTHPVVLAAQALGAALYAVSAVAFSRLAARSGDELLRWLGAGCVLAAGARIHYLLFPSLYTEYVYTGDLLRLGFYAFLLVGATREVTSFWHARAQAAVLEDRRRIARDLHDGLVQELAYIYAQSRRLAADPGDGVAVQRIGGAAGRAIDESRRAIATLTRPEEADFAVALQQSVDEMASRYDVRIAATLDPDAETDAPIAEALLRITAEAVRNAVRHGVAAQIGVRLTAAPLSLTVTDDGRGFRLDPAGGARTGGFGLTSMRERAEGVGATLSIESAPGEGTTVRVSWI